MTPEPNPSGGGTPNRGTGGEQSEECSLSGNGAGADVLQAGRARPGPALAVGGRCRLTATEAADRSARGKRASRQQRSRAGWQGSKPRRSTRRPGHRPPEAGPRGVEAAAVEPASGYTDAVTLACGSWGGLAGRTAGFGLPSAPTWPSCPSRPCPAPTRPAPRALGQVEGDRAAHDPAPDNYNRRPVSHGGKCRAES